MEHVNFISFYSLTQKLLISIHKMYFPNKRFYALQNGVKNSSLNTLSDDTE
jgi:hypothetical protein